MIKDENAELIIDGKRVENVLTFIAKESKMVIEIEFTFNASELAGKDLVTFEELYDLSNPKEPTKVAEHKDIEDEGQTVTITEKPVVPEEPEHPSPPAPSEPEEPLTPDVPEKPQTPSKPSNTPKTGDTSNMTALLAMLGMSALSLVGIEIVQYRKKKKAQ